MKIYYSHCMAIYGSPQAKRDLELLKNLGFTDIINPSDDCHKEAIKLLPNSSDKMDYFISLVLSCDALAFRALPDGAIPAGVFKEISAAKNCCKPVFELPSCILRRELSVTQTREYLSEIGQR